MSFKDCAFESSIYSTFNAHKSKEHREHNCRVFKSELIVGADMECESTGDIPPDEMNLAETDIDSDTEEDTSEADSLEVWSTNWQLYFYK